MGLIRLGLRAWKRNGFSLFLAAIGLSLITAWEVFSWSGLRALDTRVEGLMRQQMAWVWVSPDVQAADAGRMQKSLEEVIHQSQVQRTPIQVEYSPPSAFIKDLEREDPGLAKELRWIQPDSEKWIPRYFRLKGNWTPTLEAAIAKLPGVEGVESTLSRSREFELSMLQLKRLLWIGIFISAFFGFCALWLLGRIASQEYSDTRRFLVRHGASSLYFSVGMGLLLASVGLLSSVFFTVFYLNYRGMFRQMFESLLIGGETPAPLPFFGVVAGAFLFSLTLSFLAGWFSSARQKFMRR